MSIEAVTISSDRQGRSVINQDRRRGRSRSPSAYLRKKGNSLKGIISGEKIRESIKKSRSATSLLSLSGKSYNKAIDYKEDNKATGESSPIDNESSEEDITEYGVIVDEKNESDSKSDKVKTILNAAAEKLSGIKFDQDELVSTERYAEEMSRNPQNEPTPNRSNSNDLLSNDGKETVQIILLLIELRTKRFELIQLEFDPNKALVHDILSQIPKTAYYDDIKNQIYEGICSVNGEEMSDDVQLKNFVQAENEVILAIPSDITGIECVKIATPILNDDKVRAMLQQLEPTIVSFDSLLPSKEADNETSTFAIEATEPVTKDKQAEEEAAMPINSHFSAKETDDAATATESEIKESMRTTTELEPIYEEPELNSLEEKIVESVNGSSITITTEKATPTKKSGMSLMIFALSLLVVAVAVLQLSVTKPLGPGSIMKA